MRSLVSIVLAFVQMAFLAAMAAQAPQYSFVVSNGHDGWDYAAGWKSASGGWSLGRVPRPNESVAIDSAVPVRVRNGVLASGSLFVVGSRYGKGHASVLVFEAGGYPNSRYSHFYMGDVAGATGVVHLAGGEFPAWSSTANVTNISYVHVGVQGAGFFTNTAGAVYLRESFLIGEQPGSFGRYVHQGGTFHFCFGAKPFAVGVLGQGELDVQSGAMSLRDLLIGGTNTVDNVAIIREGAMVSADGIVSVGGYTNRMNSTCKRYPCGKGRMDMRGGELALTRRSNPADPSLRVGQYAGSSGEIRGWGTMSDGGATTESAYIGFGHGRVVADGGTLDLTDLMGATNMLDDASAGWYAENGGCVWLPRATLSISANNSATTSFGATPSRSTPDLVNGVRVTVYNDSSTAAHVICGGYYAADHPDAHTDSLPACRGVVGMWKLADCTTSIGWRNAPRFFKKCTLNFRYDAAKMTSAASQLMLCRYENGAWRRCAVAGQTPNCTFQLTDVLWRNGDVFNMGEYALLEVDVFGGNVSGTLTPESDGWFEIGNRNYLAKAPDGATVSEGGTNWYVNMAYPDWPNISFGSHPKRVRFVGGVMLGSLPPDVTNDFSQVASLTVITNRLFEDGTAIPVPAGAYFRYMPALVDAEPNGKLTRTLDVRSGMEVLHDALELNGTWRINDGTGNLVMDGRLSGTGKVQLSNFWRSLTITGQMDFAGTLETGGTQTGEEYMLSPSAMLSPLGGVKIFGESLTYAGSKCQQLVWNPPVSPSSLAVRRFEIAGNSGFIESKNSRYGSALCVYKGNTVHIGTFVGSGSGNTRGLHLVANRNAVGARTVQGDGNVVVEEISSAARLWLATNVNLTVGKVLEASVFDCTAERTGENVSRFSVTGPHPAACRLLATSPFLLPREIVGYTGIIEIVGTEWKVPLTTDGGRAIRPGTILPASGTITVEANKVLPAAGRYQLLTWPADSALANASDWTVAGLSGRAALCTVERTATGISLVVPEVDQVRYYVDSENGSDAALGISPATAWRSLERVNAASILPGEAVLFRRGGLWRGQLLAKSGEAGKPVLYSAYGEGEKPIIQGSVSAAAESDWTLVSNGVWRTVASYSVDVGNIIFDDGATNGWKKWSVDALANPYDYVYDRVDKRVYMRSNGNPALSHASVEMALKQHVVGHGSRHHVTFDGLWVRYGAAHGFGGGNAKGITIVNCDICWIGGGTQKWDLQTDGTEKPVRYGNGIEFWDSSADCLVASNRLWEIYDAALTSQGDTGDQTNLVWRHNVVWNSEYSYEHFNRDSGSAVVGTLVEHNTFVDAGGGWGHIQRPDVNGAHLMMWRSHGPVRDFIIRNNILCGSTEQIFRMTTDWHEKVTLSNNLHWIENNRVMRMPTAYLDFDGYLALGSETNSQFAKAVFIDPARRNYHLRRRSPGTDLASDGGAVGAFPVPPSRGMSVIWRSDGEGRDH